MSPLGNHTLTVSVEDDEEFTAETTVPYFLEEDTKPTGGPINKLSLIACCLFYNHVSIIKAMFPIS